MNFTTLFSIEVLSLLNKMPIGTRGMSKEFEDKEPDSFLKRTPTEPQRIRIHEIATAYLS